MRLARIVALAALVIPTAVAGQVPSCPGCIIGIWDDPALTTNWGSIAIFEPKEIYVGLKLSDDVDVFSGVEFSVAGINDGLSLLGIMPIGPRPLVFGTIASPRDTTATSTGVGGVSAAWGAGCKHSGEALFKLVLMSGEQVSNRVLRVKRSYPTSNPMWQAPVLIQCDPPVFTAWTVSGGCYILNPDGPSDCVDPNAVAIAPRSWSAMKGLYR